MTWLWRLFQVSYYIFQLVRIVTFKIHLEVDNVLSCRRWKNLYSNKMLDVQLEIWTDTVVKMTLATREILLLFFD